MLKLNLSAENLRKLALVVCTSEMAEIIPDFDLESIGNSWTDAALDQYREPFERSYSQSVGSFVIVQGGTEGEKQAWSAAIDTTEAAAKKNAVEIYQAELKSLAAIAADEAKYAD